MGSAGVAEGLRLRLSPEKVSDPGLLGCEPTPAADHGLGGLCFPPKEVQPARPSPGDPWKGRGVLGILQEVPRKGWQRLACAQCPCSRSSPAVDLDLESLGSWGLGGTEGRQWLGQTRVRGLTQFAEMPWVCLEGWRVAGVLQTDRGPQGPRSPVPHEVGDHPLLRWGTRNEWSHCKSRFFLGSPSSAGGH